MVGSHLSPCLKYRLIFFGGESSETGVTDNWRGVVLFLYLIFLFFAFIP